MPERKAQHHTWTETNVQTSAASTMSLTLAELAQFVADCEAAGIPGKASVSVGGVSVHTESYGQKDCWATRISVRASQADIDRAATTSEELPMPDVDPIVAALVAERRRQGLSLREVGRRAGISIGGMSEIEDGKHSPRLSTLACWARALGVRVTFTTSEEAER